MTDTQLGVVLPTGAGVGARELVAFAREAEALGFGSLWVGDTLLRPVVEPFVMLAAAAAVTERIRLGTAALLPALRRPVQTAHAIASLDQLSGGRLTITVGAGFPRRSEAVYALSSVPWERRFARLDETVSLWRQLWSRREKSDFDGSFFTFAEVSPTVEPVQAGGPPIWLGGAGPAALRRTGLYYDGWLPYPPDPATYADGLAEIRRAGRAVTPALFATVLIADDPAAGRRALGDYVRRSYGMPLEVVEKIQLLITGPAEHIAAELDRYRCAGAVNMVCRLGAIGLTDQRRQLELLSRLPRYGSLIPR